MSKAEITHVTDTALWVAAYRAQESERQDALFKDPYASLLIGDMGALIATRTQGSRYTGWSVVIRTFIIDKFITEMVAQKKVDTILNLGSGLDTRPYRLPLSSQLRWIEVDFPQIIDHKKEKLKDHKTFCHLEVIALDLSNNRETESLFERISSESGNVLVLTEGVIPYLSNDEVSYLGKALYKHENFRYWIAEYYSQEILDFLRTPKRIKQMKNAPFLFYPESWFDFFQSIGWNESQIKYLAIESEKVGRTPPTSGWLKNENDFDLEAKKESIKYFLGYVVFDRVKKPN